MQNQRPFSIFAEKLLMIVDTILISIGVVALCIVLLGIRVFFVKGGKFPSSHIHDNPAMRKKHIGCALREEMENINLKSASNLNGNLNCSKELEHYAS